MQKITLSFILTFGILSLFAQTEPEITSWLQNNSLTGKYYVDGNPTLIETNILSNCQQVEYSDNYVYIHTHGLPTYPFGPFGFVDDTEEKTVIYKFPLNPTPNTGQQNQTRPGNIGVLINGTSLFDFRDDVAWDNENNTLCGGPLNSPCPGGMGATQDWNRDAVLAEKWQFDCSKGHGGVETFHHHQNPTAYKLDLEVISDICNLYDSDGLYQLDSTMHSPLVGFAYDGYPVYGSYGYKNTDGTGGITRIKSGYHLKNITTRTNGPDIGQVVTYTAGPPQDPDTFNDTLYLGYFREDYEHIPSTDPDVLDEHNGRFCVTPEYPNGTYTYFLTVDENWNSIYPYSVGPTFYGVVEEREVESVDEPTTIYDPLTNVEDLDHQFYNVTVFPNLASDLIAVQINGLVKENIQVRLFSMNGQEILSKTIDAGSTIAYFDTQTLYSGMYLITITNGTAEITKKVIVE